MKKSGLQPAFIFAFFLCPLFIFNGIAQDEEQGDLIYIIADNESPIIFPK